MKQTTAPKKTLSPAGGPSETATTAGRSPRAEFLAASLSMSWQLAIVVLVPIIGGFKLDEALDTLPFLTFVGFTLAMIGMGVVVWRQMQRYTPAPTKEPKS